MFEGIKKHLDSVSDETIRRYATYYMIALGFVVAFLHLVIGGSLMVALTVIPLNILMIKAYYFVFDYFNSRSELNKLIVEGL